MNEQLQQREPQRMSFSQYINSKTGQSLVSNAIKDPRRRNAFVTAIVSAVAANPGLQECTAPSIISAALQGVSMGLAPSPQLGQFYMIPFKNKKAGVTEATFVPGYKGYVQLALRSGQYMDIDAQSVHEGEYKGRDRFTGRPVFEWFEDYAQEEQSPVVGYEAHFELINGARKVIYWPREKMIAHADRYSPAFSIKAKKINVRGEWKTKVSYEDFLAGNYPKSDEWMYSSYWYTDFDDMARKTMLRQLITKWGPVSVDMESAITQDDRVDAEGVDYGVDFSVDDPVQVAAEIEAAEEQSQTVYGEVVSIDDI